MIKYIIFLLLISFNSFGQLTPTQLTQVNGLIATSNKNLQSDYNSKIKPLQDDNAVTKKRLLDLENDSIALGVTLTYANKLLNVVGNVIDPKLLDSLRQVFKDIKLLYSNDAAETKTRSDSDKIAFSRWRVTDSLTGQNNAALRGLGNLVSIAGKNIISANARIDSVVTNEIDYDIPIQGVQDSVNETNKNVEAVKSDADKIKAFLSTTFINFHQ